MCACDLTEVSGRAQPPVSHHMKILFDAGLVTREKRGLWAWYRAVPQRLDAYEPCSLKTIALRVMTVDDGPSVATIYAEGIATRNAMSETCGHGIHGCRRRQAGLGEAHVTGHASPQRSAAPSSASTSRSVEPAHASSWSASRSTTCSASVSATMTGAFPLAAARTLAG